MVKTTQRDRQATETAILNAFGRVLLREGVTKVGVNGVAKEAGVNKVLIYRYFGGLPQLAYEWARCSDFWPSEMDLIGGDETAFAALPVRERVITVLFNFADQLRSRPHTIEVLASELTNPNDVSKALEDGKVEFGEGLARYIKLDINNDAVVDKVWRLIVVVYTLTTDFCVRQQNNPNYFGMDLREERSWDFLKETIRSLADKYLDDEELR